MKVTLCFTTNEQVMAKFGPEWAKSLLDNTPIPIEHALEAHERNEGGWAFENGQKEFFVVRPKEQAIHDGMWVMSTATSTYIFKPL